MSPSLFQGFCPCLEKDLKVLKIRIKAGEVALQTTIDLLHRLKAFNRLKLEAMCEGKLHYTVYLLSSLLKVQHIEDSHSAQEIACDESGMILDTKRCYADTVSCCRSIIS